MSSVVGQVMNGDHVLGSQGGCIFDGWRWCCSVLLNSAACALPVVQHTWMHHPM